MVSTEPTFAPARVLLINLNRYDQPYPVYPLGLAYIEGALRRAGHESQIWDARAAKDTLEARIAAMQPDYVGLSLRNVDNVQYHNPKSFVHELLDCCRRVRSATRAPLIIGGSAFSVFPQEIFVLTGVDYGIQGEGEAVLVELLAALQAGRPVPALPGLVYRDGQGGVVAVPRTGGESVFTTEPLHDTEILQVYTGQGSLPGVQTQRGCALKCCYCTYPVIEGRRSRYRSGPEVVEEMRRLSAQGVRYTFIVDSVFNMSVSHVTGICEELIRAKLDMHWECFLRPRGVTRELLTLMRRAGMRHVEFGSDSFSDPVLKSYGKSFDYGDIERASREAHALDLHYSHFLIFGGPGETPETVEETLTRAQSLPGAFYFATIGMRIYPGTPLWRQLAPESRGETPAEYLVDPRFYLAPGFTVDGLHRRLQRMQHESHNWVVGDPSQEFVTTMEKLRRRGIRGPMWEYIELLQRYAFQPVAAMRT